MQGRLSPQTAWPRSSLSEGLVTLLLVLPWVHPWAPSPLANTVPLLIGWGSLAKHCTFRVVLLQYAHRIGFQVIQT